MRTLYCTNVQKKITKERFDELNEYLKAESLEELEEKGILAFPDDEIYFVFDFENSYQIVINVSSGNTNYWCDISLLDEDGIYLDSMENLGELTEQMELVSTEGTKYVCQFEII